MGTTRNAPLARKQGVGCPVQRGEPQETRQAQKGSCMHQHGLRLARQVAQRLALIQQRERPPLPANGETVASCERLLSHKPKVSMLVATRLGLALRGFDIGLRQQVTQSA
jgi:hypothetical protein